MRGAIYEWQRDDLKSLAPVMEKVSPSRKKFFFKRADLNHEKKTSSVPS